MDDSGDRDDQGWLSGDFGTAYRTACLLLGDPTKAEAAVQEAFVRVWRFRDAVPGGDARRPWLYRAVVHASRSSVAAQKSLPPEVLEPALEGLADGPAEFVEPTGVSADVIAAVADLPESVRVPLVLHFSAGLSEQEIAIAIDRRLATVRSRLHDARQRLALDPRLSAWAVPTAEVSR